MASVQAQRKGELYPILRSSTDARAQPNATLRTAVSQSSTARPSSYNNGGGPLSRILRPGGQLNGSWQSRNTLPRHRGGDLRQKEHMYQSKEALRDGGNKQGNAHVQNLWKAGQPSSIPRTVAMTPSKPGSQSTSYAKSQKGLDATHSLALRRLRVSAGHPTVAEASPAGAIKPSLGTSCPLKCTFCGAELLTRKYFASAWPEFIMCAKCKDGLPTCHVCHRKAAHAEHTDICWLPSKFVGNKESSTTTGLTDQENRRTLSGGCHRPPASIGGLNLCSECVLLFPVVEDKQVNRLFKEAVTILRKEASISFDDSRVFHQSRLVEPATASGLADKNGCGGFPFPVHAVDLASLKTSIYAKHSLHGGHTTFGRCETLEIIERQTNPPLVSRMRAVRQILVAKGLPESVFLAHLAHELMHAFLWCSSNGGHATPSIDLAVEEGLCNVIAARVLELRDAQLASSEKRSLVGEQSCTARAGRQSDVSHAQESGKRSRTSHLTSSEAAANVALIAYERKVIAVRLSMMSEDKDKIYGDGYRAVRRAVEALGIKRALQLVRTAGSSLEMFKRAVFGSSILAQTHNIAEVACSRAC
ncbi:conserved hypothetical protein [Neospora caninum Liverpool]|uniref:Protein DA1-like domain-containing protein n=1 Tax=Neospora caninum (strain Liverpool) TaxID=572307 RepID=F0VEG3_NEOCL|nr:conserved hypothetical protein [Neospora caninum Liverpool]CBZ52107.1 conserved hypothetical protein [Neospora caninum Liverpool]CEL66069.1 TPA: hypothetical protein BN1204_018960 [Neospora caninum Liverpool]|eukprot:XP_003882139.1 conserved hypothetical protein [Neospora caninum Liverpool]